MRHINTLTALQSQTTFASPSFRSQFTLESKDWTLSNPLRVCSERLQFEIDPIWGNLDNVDLTAVYFKCMSVASCFSKWFQSKKNIKRN